MLKVAISSWDAKDVHYIKQVYKDYLEQDDFSALLLKYSHDAELQRGSTWLLKKHLEEGNSLTSSETAELFSCLDKLEHWEAKLHVLQCLPFLAISVSQKESIDVFLRGCLSSDFKFVRAWAYGGLYELAKQHSQYQAEVKTLLEQASVTEAASVKARVRQVLKKGF